MVTFNEARDRARRALSKYQNRVDRLARDIARTMKTIERDIDSKDKKVIAHVVEQVFGAYLAKRIYEYL